MGRFIGALAVKVLVGRAGMINFIKVSARIPARFTHAGILLVQQSGGILSFRQHIRAVSCMGDDTRRQVFAGRAAEGHFEQIQSGGLRIQPQIFPMERQTALRGIIAVFRIPVYVRPRFKRIIPAIAKALPHLAGIIFRPDDAIFADSDGEAVVANAGIIQEVEILTFFQFEGDLFFCRAGHHAMLRSHRAAQISKGQHSIESCHHAHYEPVFPAQRQPWVVRMKQHFFVGFRNTESGHIAVGSFFLRLGLLFQRDAPIRRQAHPRAEAKQKQIQNAKDHIERQRIVVQMSQRGTVQNRIIQHNCRIQKGRDTEADHQPQQPPIPGTDIAQQEQAQCREQIPFVNFHGQHVNSRQQQRQKAGKMLCIGMMQTAQDNGSVDQCHHCIAVQAPRAAHRRHHKQIYGKHRAKQADLSILGA